MAEEQTFYIKYNSDDGYVLGQLTEKGFNQLSDDDKKNYTSVTVDQSHLYGWGKYWYTVRYVNGALSYPDNWPKDQTQQISDLSGQIKQLTANNQTANQNSQKLQDQLSSANQKIAQLGQLSMQLQMQLAKANQNGGNK